MAQPARKQQYDEDLPKDLVDARPKFEVHQGGGESTGRSKEHLSVAGEGDDKLPASKAEELEARKLGEQSQSEDDPWDKASSMLQKAKDEDAGKSESLYKDSEQSTSKMSGLFSGIKKRKKMAIIGGIGGATLITMIFGLFGFLNVFKLDHIISNVDAKTMARFNSSADARSDKWIRSYIMLRLTRLEGNGGFDQDSEFFRANRVDNDQPMRDLYRTLLSSKFEADLAKRGIVFANREVDNRIKFVVMEIDGKQFAGLDAGDVRNGDLVARLNSGDLGGLKTKIDIDLRDPGGSAKARKEIREVTRHHNVLVRRTVRKAWANQTNVKNWRFFEKTRDKVDNSKRAMRLKIVAKVFPLDADGFPNGAVSKYINCLIGNTTCIGSSDQQNPANRASAGEPGGDGFCESGSTRCEQIDGIEEWEGNENNDTNARPRVDPDTGTVPVSSDRSTTGRLVQATRSIAGASKFAGGFISIIGLLEVLSNIDATLTSGGLSKMVTQARGIQALSLWQSMATARDQIKSGELTDGELNQLMQVINKSANSEGWTYVVKGEGEVPNDASLAPSPARQEYCSGEHQSFILNPANAKEANSEYHYLCPQNQIGAKSNAKKIEDIYTSPFLAPLRATATVWNSIKSAGGGFIGAIVSGFFRAAERLFSAASSVIINFVEAMGGGRTLKKLTWAISQAMLRLMTFLGAGPLLTGDEPDGVLFNYMVQGGVFGAETTARERGASATTDASRKTATENTQKSENEHIANMSTFDKYLSLSETKSVASKGLFAVTNFKISSLNSYVKNGLSGILASIFRPLQPSTSAFNFDVYAGTKFADIQSYDYPPECFALDPLNATANTPAYTPLNGTNLEEVLAKYGVSVAEADLGATPQAQWETVNDPIRFYDLMYKKISEIGGSVVIGANPIGADINQEVAKNPDGVALQIHNCHLLDSSVRGGLGAVYGYDKDYGYAENVSPVSATPQPEAVEGKSVYIIGDSLTVGMRNSGNIEQKLTTNGWVVNGIQAAQSETVTSALPKMDTDNTGISASDVVVVALGTNPAGANQATVTADIQRMVAKIKTFNANAQIVWVNVFTINNAYDAANNALNTQSSSLGFKVIDWRAEARANASRYPFANDGIHHTAPGYDAKATFIADQLGPGGGSNGGGSIAGLESPPNLANPVNNYYRMPDSTNGLYTFNSGTPSSSRCGSKALVDAIYTVAQVWATRHPNNKLVVGDLNAPGHASHTTGIDVDIYTIGEYAANVSGNREASIELGKLFVDTGLMTYIFYNDTAVQTAVNAYAVSKGLSSSIMRPWPNHENHFHVRILETYALPTTETCPSGL